jgi:hypothetical protein
MVRSISIIVSIMVVTVLALIADRAPDAYARDLLFLVPLIGLAAVVWSSASDRRREP